MAEAVKDYQKLEHDIIRLAGGADNIASAQRCATRLRLVLKNTPGQAEEKIKALPGVITVVQKQGQFQVVIGNHVGDVFEAVSAELETNKKTEQEERPKEKESPEHSSGGHPSRHINYNTDSDHPCQSPFRPGKQGVNQSSLCFHCHKDRHTGQHTHHTYQSVLTV